ncbi:MAG: hypothetical protein CSA26_09735 [Desulfobacterales bacterium]|nr:MAG: hypothetical protein CSA26_09735 [Desulfobacterales bacterium]
MTSISRTRLKRLWFVCLTALVAFISPTDSILAADQGTILVAVKDSPSDVLYTVNPVTGEYKKFFDFTNHPKDDTGSILSPRVSPDGKLILFHSNNSYIWGPAFNNLFSINGRGGNRNQITPGAHSGQWMQGTGVVTGKVFIPATSGGERVAVNALVYLEGMDPVYTDTSGNFRIENAPTGARWLVAYYPGATQYFDCASVNVIPGTTTGPLTLSIAPSGFMTSRANFEQPIYYDGRVYHLPNAGLANLTIKYTDLAGEHGPTTVYATQMDTCFADVHTYDVGSKTGKLLFVNYQNGCNNQEYHSGIYTADKDGNNLQIIYNMAANTSTYTGWPPNGIFTGDFQILWNWQETRFAIRGPYYIEGNKYHAIHIFSADGIMLSSAWGDTTSQYLYLHGWSPDGNWLLYSQKEGPSAPSSLHKIRVQENGRFDMSSDVTIFSSTFINGATWGPTLTSPSFCWPLLIPSFAERLPKGKG